MDLLQLLATIDNTNLHINEVGGRLKLTGPAGDRAHVRSAVAEHRDFLLAHLRGIRTGHLLAFCDTCGAATLTAPRHPTVRGAPPGPPAG